MTHIPTAGPRNRKYMVYWRTVNSSIRTSAATFDLNSRQVIFVYMHISATHYVHLVVVYMYKRLLCMSDLVGHGILIV